MGEFVVFLGDGSTFDPNGLVKVSSEDVDKLQSYIQDNNETLERLTKHRKGMDGIVSDLRAELGRLKSTNNILSGNILELQNEAVSLRNIIENYKKAIASLKKGEQQ